MDNNSFTSPDQENSQDQNLYQKELDQLYRDIEQLVALRKYKSARLKVDEFYESHQEEKDFFYWDTLFDIHLAQEKKKENYQDWNFSFLDKDMAKMQVELEKERLEAENDPHEKESYEEKRENYEQNLATLENYKNLKNGDSQAAPSVTPTAQSTQASDQSFHQQPRPYDQPQPQQPYGQPQPQQPSYIPSGHQSQSSSGSKTLWLALIGVAALALIVFFMFKFFATNGGGDKANSIGSELYTPEQEEAPYYPQEYYPDYDWLSTRLATPGDLYGLDSEELRIMRNYIFARHGYIFKSPELTDYFSHYSWYYPRYTNVTHDLNKIELQNIEFIKKYE